MGAARRHSLGDGALLFLGNYNGTLAAARCLGEHGIDVALADPSPLVRARASRYVRHFERAPPLNDAGQFMDWLLDRGRGAARKSLAGRVLFPATDEQVFLFARHRDELSRHYRLYQPSFDTVYRILNKQRLYEACAQAGVKYPTTWFPRGEAEMRGLLPEIRVDVMVKPKTQIQLKAKAKGTDIPSGASIADCYARFARGNRYGPEVVAHDAEVAWPMIQAYHRSETHPIYSLAGFIGDSGAPFLVRAAAKVLQRPRNMGVGVCFEAADLDVPLAERIAALCRNLGYCGIFDIEFIQHQGEFLLIDFNPRAYGQMAFEIARGIPGPYLHYLEAIRDERRLAEAYRLAGNWQAQGREAYCHELLLSLMNAVQGANQMLTGLESERWGSWMRARRDQLTDAVRHRGDPGPSAVDLMRHVADFLRHPRSFVQSLMR